MSEFDVAIIGAGAVGLAVARAYAEGGARVAVLERHSGPGREQSTHNSGVVHSGLFARPGTLRARLNVEGNARL
ncbi:MAG TPA: FAD-dependent oxidoreductase, partial [Thermoplasmata archaeon]|nr:FAD-dependent oxidoreductase [Thermoplasmata archaeon]